MGFAFFDRALRTNSSIYKQSLLYILVSTLFSCAVQVPPGGGTKDTSPPVVLKMKPENKTVFFDSKEIQIRFDEFIILNNPNEQVIVSPPLEERPEFEVSGKTLKVKHLGSLKRNTTYTINFGNAVTDNHESNIADHLHYVFSTGSYLDSNFITGNILNAFTLKPEKSISIGLYETTGFTDSAIYKKKPVYYSKTKDNGDFVIENIPDKRFILVAFDDQNKNLKFNRGEGVAFVDSAILSTDTILRKRTLKLFVPDAYPINHLVDTFCKEAGKFSFLIYKPNRINIRPVKNIPYFLRLTKGINFIDTLHLFSNELTKDSVADFIITQPERSAYAHINVRKRAKKPSFGVTTKPGFELNDTILINCSNPYQSFDSTRIILLEDTIQIKPLFITDSNKFIVAVLYKWKEKTKYSLMIKDSAFKDIYGLYCKKYSLINSTKAIKDYSSLKLNILLDRGDKSYIIQLTNDNESDVINEFIINHSEEKLFECLMPGSYKIKIIYDENKNGRWDNGNYFMKRQPEKVYYYNEVVSLKAFWDIEQNIDLNSIIK